MKYKVITSELLAPVDNNIYRFFQSPLQAVVSLGAGRP